MAEPVLHSHFVPELAVVPRYTGDDLHLFPARGAQVMDRSHLSAYQSSPAIVGMGGHQLDTAGRYLDAAV